MKEELLYTSGYNPADIFLYKYLKCIEDKFPGKEIDLSNQDIADNLHWELKALKRRLTVLKDLNLIRITGATRNRRIICNSPEDIIEDNKHKKKILNRKRKAVKKNATKVLQLKATDYFKRFQIKTNPKALKKILYDFAIEKKEELGFIDYVRLREFTNLELIGDSAKIIFLEYMKLAESIQEQKSVLLKRAREYDHAHRESEFINELNSFFMENTAYLTYKGNRYKGLSKCPLKLVKAFLNWLEPGLYD